MSEPEHLSSGIAAALTGQVVDAALEVHRHLGPGLLESAYEACLTAELEDRGLRVRRQVPMPVLYKGRGLDCGYRIDLLVEETVVVELKATPSIEGIHIAQMLTYLKLAGLRVGLILNFNVRLLKDGIKRVSL